MYIGYLKGRPFLNTFCYPGISLHILTAINNKSGLNIKTYTYIFWGSLRTKINLIQWLHWVRIQW